MGLYYYATPCHSSGELDQVTGFLDRAIAAGVCFDYQLLKITSVGTPFEPDSVCVIWSTDSKNDAKGLGPYRCRYLTESLELLESIGVDLFDVDTQQSDYGEIVNRGDLMDFNDLNASEFIPSPEMKYVYLLEDLYIDFDWRKYRKKIDVVFWKEEPQELLSDRDPQIIVVFRDNTKRYHAVSKGPGLFRIHEGPHDGVSSNDESKVLGYLSATIFCRYFDEPTGDFTAFLNLFKLGDEVLLITAIEQFRSDRDLQKNYAAILLEYPPGSSTLEKFYMDADHLDQRIFELEARGYSHIIINDECVTGWFFSEKQAVDHLTDVFKKNDKAPYFLQIRPIQYLQDVLMRRSAAITISTKNSKSPGPIVYFVDAAGKEIKSVENMDPVEVNAIKTGDFIELEDEKNNKRQASVPLYEVIRIHKRLKNNSFNLIVTLRLAGGQEVKKNKKAV